MPLAYISGVNTDSYAYRKAARVYAKAERPTGSNKRARLANAPRTVAGAPPNEGKDAPLSFSLINPVKYVIRF
jgi:hypothetical protein